jgi:hypothetical protein
MPSPRHRIVTVYPAPELLADNVGRVTVTPAELEAILNAGDDGESDDIPPNGWELEFTQMIDVPLGGGAKTTTVAACMVFLKEREL